MREREGIWLKPEGENDQVRQEGGEDGRDGCECAMSVLKFYSKAKGEGERESRKVTRRRHRHPLWNLSERVMERRRREGGSYNERESGGAGSRGCCPGGY